jgi:hypothetical protein
MYMMIVPKKKAKATDTKIANITCKALSVFKSKLCDKLGSLMILMEAIANVAPRSSKTMETVVDVGRPKLLKRSSKMTSVTIAATKMSIIS